MLAGEDFKDLRILHYPDPRLRKKCEPVAEFNGDLAALAERMIALMESGSGVGLAAAQVGVNQRVIVVNATGDPQDTEVFVNPLIHEPHGSEEAEEGCLSLPGVRVQIRRAQKCRLTAQDLKGRPIERELDELLARVVQHETDHLNGVLIIDRMGPTDRIATRKTLRALEEQYHPKAVAR